MEIPDHDPNGYVADVGLRDRWDLQCMSAIREQSYGRNLFKGSEVYQEIWPALRSMVPNPLTPTQSVFIFDFEAGNGSTATGWTTFGRENTLPLPGAAALLRQ